MTKNIHTESLNKIMDNFKDNMKLEILELHQVKQCIDISTVFNGFIDTCSAPPDTSYTISVTVVLVNDKIMTMKCNLDVEGGKQLVT